MNYQGGRAADAGSQNRIGNSVSVCAHLQMFIKHKLIYLSKTYLSNAVVAKEKAAKQDQEVNLEHTSKTNTYSL